jgi:ArsR family transcriptional regulator, arsenate/arsenite/antimonite-responsive transcriptional repressor
VRDAAQFFKVLADEARLKMLWLLFNHRELCVCDMMEALEITQSKASRHLITLRHAGLVTDRKEGLWSYYQLRPVADELAERHLEVLRTTLARRDDAAPLLAKLHAWLQAENRRAECAKDAACTAARPRRAGARSKPTQLAGGSR